MAKKWPAYSAAAPSRKAILKARHVVTWALGHLVTLAEPEDFDSKYKTWSLVDNLPILPKRIDLKVIRVTSYQFKAVAQLCRRSDIGKLMIAADAGREREWVARWIMELVCGSSRRPTKRSAKASSCSGLGKAGAVAAAGAAGPAVQR